MTTQIWRQKNTGMWCVVELDDAGHVTNAAGQLGPQTVDAITSTMPLQWPDIDGNPDLAAHMNEHKDNYTLMGPADVLDALMEASMAKYMVIPP